MLNNFKNQLLLERKSKHTVRNYIEKINIFLQYSKGNTSQESINKFLLSLSNKSISTSNIYAIILKKYLHFINRQDIILPKAHKNYLDLPKYLTMTEFNDILKYVPSIFPNNTKKIIALLNFDFFTGIRNEEHYNLKRYDFDFNRKRVKILGKGNKERIIPLTINNKLISLLQDYFNSEPEEKNAFNLGKGAIAYIYFRRLKQEFPELKLHPHIMRTSFATHLAILGFNAYDIMVLMGHEDIKTTMRYVGRNIDIIEEKLINLRRAL